MADSAPETADCFQWDSDDMLRDWGVPSPTDRDVPTVRVLLFKKAVADRAAQPLELTIDTGDAHIYLRLDEMLARVISEALIEAASKVSEIQNPAPEGT